MTSATSPFPEHDKPRSRWIWGWACYLLLSGGIVGLMLVGRLNGYFEGLSLGQSDTLLAVAISLMLLACLLLLAMLGIFALYRIIRGRDHWLKLGILALPVVGMAIGRYLPLPTFNDGVRETLRTKTSGADFVGLAKATVATPPKWLADDETPAFSANKEAWIKAVAPFDRLSVEPHPKVSLKGKNLLLEWGGPFSRRWGLAISSVPGAKPEIPSHATYSEEIHPEVWLFNSYL